LNVACLFVLIYQFVLVEYDQIAWLFDVLGLSAQLGPVVLLAYEIVAETLFIVVNELHLVRLHFRVGQRLNDLVLVLTYVCIKFVEIQNVVDVELFPQGDYVQQLSNQVENVCRLLN